MIKIKLPNNKEVELDPASLGNLTAEQQANIAGFINALAKPDPPTPPASEPAPPAMIVAPAHTHETAPAKPQSRAARHSNRVPRPDALPSDASPYDRAKLLLHARPRSHRAMDHVLVRVGRMGALTNDFVQAVNVSQSEVSRAISGLRKIEAESPLPSGSLLQERQEGRSTRWYAGTLLAEMLGVTPQDSSQSHTEGASSM